MKLFRFRGINEYLWQELEFGEIYACEPALLNDPFDTQFDPFGSIKRAIETAKSDDRRSTLEAIRQSFLDSDPRKKKRGICCFSNSMESHLMWAHYAHSHTGVCLLYDLPDDYLSNKYPSAESDHYLVGIASVDYGDDAFFDWLLQSELDQPFVDEPIVNAAAKTLVTKGKCWSYEEEVRIVMSQPGFVQIEHAFLTQVAFGLRTPERQRNLISRMAKRNNPSVAIVETTRSTTSDFGLQFIDVLDV